MTVEVARVHPVQPNMELHARTNAHLDRARDTECSLYLQTIYLCTALLEQLSALFFRTADTYGFSYDPAVFEYMLEKHYRHADRPLRFCHARDILSQVKNLCEFHERPFELTETNIDVAVYNYFAGL